MTAPAPTRLRFACIAGPDQGKRITLYPGELILGTGAHCNVRCEDPELAEQFVRLELVDGGLQIRALVRGALPAADGRPRSEMRLAAGEQVRLGRSVWELAPAHEHGDEGLLAGIGDKLTSIAGLDRTRDWNISEMFSEAFKRHRDEEVEAYFTVGTEATAPALAEIDARWPRPWVFLRVMLMALGLYYAFVLSWNEFQNPKLIPGLIVTGSFAVPFALLVLFFELNVPRNISLYQVVKLLCLGGIVSIAVSLFGFRWTGLSNWMGAAAAGIIEETGKALTLLLVVRRPRYRWTLNGLLLGATIGAGFAAFESAGYALDIGLDAGAEAMRQNLVLRGVLSLLGGHVLWTGLVGAALWRVKGNSAFRAEMLTDQRFLRVLGLSMAMHMLWNSPLKIPFYGKFLAIGAVCWLLVLGFTQAGLREIRAAQAEAGA